MRRLLITLAAALPLFGVAVARADSSGSGSGTGTEASQALVVGTVVSVDPSAGTFVAKTFVVPAFGGGHGYAPGSSGGGNGSSAGGFGFFGPGGGTASSVRSHATPTTGGSGGSSGPRGSGTPTVPTATQVTITVASSTKLIVNGKTGTLSDLSAGDQFGALFSGSASDSIDTLVKNAALDVFARTPPKPHQLYAFVGTVTAVDSTAGTVTVKVDVAIPNGLIPSGSGAQTFTVSDSTLILGGLKGNGLSGGSLGDVSVGDIVAGGLIGDSGLTLTQVESTPLKVLLDIPASSSSGSPSTTTAKTKATALKRALTLLGHKSSKKSHKKHKKSHKKHAHAKRA